MKASRNPSHQPSGAFRVRTIELILSVTELNVWPGAITGGTPLPTTARFGSSTGSRLSVIYSPSSGLTFRTAAR